MKFNLLFATLTVELELGKSFDTKLIEIMKDKGKIAAVKYHREIKNSSLKDAVDYVHDLMAKGHPTKQF